MLNYSVGFLEKPIESKDALNLFLKIIEHRLSIEKDELNQHNYLVAVGNLLHKYPSTKPQAEFAKNYARGDAITRDLSRLLKWHSEYRKLGGQIDANLLIFITKSNKAGHERNLRQGV